MNLYHGGKAGLRPGDLLVPAPPHVDDGCPVCVARREGRVFTVAEMRAWARSMGRAGERILRSLEGAPANAPIDPPTAQEAVYVTASVPYATWYAARSRGDLYRVRPVGELTPSVEDHFPTWTVSAARVVEVVRRGVVLTRKERREIERLWRKADTRAARAAARVHV